jgi:hypothetical protein
MTELDHVDMPGYWSSNGRTTPLGQWLREQATKRAARRVPQNRLKVLQQNDKSSIQDINGIVRRQHRDPDQIESVDEIVSDVVINLTPKGMPSRARHRTLRLQVCLPDPRDQQRWVQELLEEDPRGTKAEDLPWPIRGGFLLQRFYSGWEMMQRRLDTAETSNVNTGYRCSQAMRQFLELMYLTDALRRHERNVRRAQRAEGPSDAPL